MLPLIKVRQLFLTFAKLNDPKYQQSEDSGVLTDETVAGKRTRPVFPIPLSYSLLKANHDKDRTHKEMGNPIFP
jgi:hypothetical protein